MINYKKIYFLILAFVTLATILFSCSTDETKGEVQKLLKKQAKVQEKRKEVTNSAFDQAKIKEKLIKGNQSDGREFSVKKDSNLTDKRSAKTLKIQQQGNSKTEKLDVAKKEYGLLQDEKGSLTIKEGTTLHTENQVREHKELAKEKLIAGIIKSDSRLVLIERKSLIKQKEISINEQRIILAQKKVELLDEEKSIYLLNKNEALINGGDDIELEYFDLKISEIEASIEDERNSVKSLENSINSVNSWLKDANELKKKLRISIEEEYKKNKIVDIHINDEVKLAKQKELVKIPLEISAGNEEKVLENKKAAKTKEENTRLDILDKTIKKSDSFLGTEDEIEIEDSKKRSAFQRLFRTAAFLGIILLIVLYIVGKRKLKNKEGLV